MRTAAEQETLAHFRVGELDLEAVVFTYKHMGTDIHCPTVLSPPQITR
jgi:hypothetical protein